MKIYLIVGNNVNLGSFSFERGSLKIGVDHGAFLALSNGVDLDYAVGDFDSCNSSERDLIFQKVKHVILLNPIKDETDTNYAYQEFKDQKDVSFVILGGITGKRIEHFYANLELVMKDERVCLLDNDTLISQISHDVSWKKDEYHYLSFFPIEEEAILSLRGFAYEGEKILLKKGKGLGISNEIVKEEAHLILNKGKLLCFRSKNDN